MKQQTLYEPTKTWLESQGFRAMVTGASKHFVVPVSDLFSAPFMVPDIVGVDEGGRVVIAEVETDKEKLFDALGRCMLWRCMATFVYLVYPKGQISRAPFLRRLGIGLLEADPASLFVTELVGLPRRDLFAVLELHPTDPAKEQQVAKHIRESLI
jgi:hypothetical protein